MNLKNGKNLRHVTFTTIKQMIYSWNELFFSVIKMFSIQLLNTTRYTRQSKNVYSHISIHVNFK
jgi:hypothetical protein